MKNELLSDYLAVYTYLTEESSLEECARELHADQRDSDQGPNNAQGSDTLGGSSHQETHQLEHDGESRQEHHGGQHNSSQQSL